MKHPLYKQPKIVALLPIKNEAWILPAFIESTLRVVDQIIALDDNSTDGTKEILAANGRIKVISINDHVQNEERVDMSLRRNILLTEARKMDATYQLWLDADEIIAEKNATDLREAILRLTPGQHLWLPWITLWKKPVEMRVDSVWKKLKKDFAFCDDGKSNFGVAELSETRTPYHTESTQNRSTPENIYADIPVLHFQFVNWKRSEIKQAWYMCHELLQEKRSARRINATYSVSLDSPHVKTDAISYFSDTEKVLFEKIRLGTAQLDITATTQYKEIIESFNERGVLYFEKLNIWHIQELREIFIKITGRTPRADTFPRWIIKLNSFRHHIRSAWHRLTASVQYVQDTFFKKIIRTIVLHFRSLVKATLSFLPYPLNWFVIYVAEYKGRLTVLSYKKKHEHAEYQDILATNKWARNRQENKLDTKAHKENNKKVNILFYHVSALSFGGTEKFLQIIAKHLDPEKFNIYFMYSPKPRASSGTIYLDARKPYLSESPHINLIEFSYDSIDQEYPYIISNPSPNMFKTIREKEIDLVFTAGSGYAEYPFNMLMNTPVILINIFGSPTTLSNIKKIISISHAVDKKICKIVPNKKREVLYIQSEKPNEIYKSEGQKLREKFNIKETDFVFGRIGRADDSIFDPIAIKAFKKIFDENPEFLKTVHYIIMSAPPLAKKLVEDSHIPNVHFVDASAKESDIWMFHYSIDALAHFRLDGESFGLNIAESMLAGNPIITHKSHIWNAQTEYLDPSFSFVVNQNHINEYAAAMKTLIHRKIHEPAQFTAMRNASLQQGNKLFVMNQNIHKIEEMVLYFGK